MASANPVASQSYTFSDHGHVEDRHTVLSSRPRTMSHGGGRAWSEEEESYLLETRNHKMPYKHIAAHLQKTELACRLHYHQLSFGTKRRKRTSSISSRTSAGSTTANHDPNYGSPVQAQRSLPNPSPPHSPKSTSTTSTSVQTPGVSVAILPKIESKSEALLPSNNSLQIAVREPVYFVAPVEPVDEHPQINRDRLAHIYESRRVHFWTAIAQEYGENVQPALLEDVWYKECATPSSTYPPTPPTRSPRSTQVTPLLASAFLDNRPGGSFCPINSPRNGGSTPRLPSRGSFAISSLLTEDRDVRSPGSQ